MRTNENLMLTVQLLTSKAAQSVAQNTGTSDGAEFRKLMSEKYQDTSAQASDGISQAPSAAREQDSADEELRQEVAAAMTALAGTAIQPQIVTEEVLPQQETAVRTVTLPTGQVQEMTPETVHSQEQTGQAAFTAVRMDTEPQQARQTQAPTQTEVRTKTEVSRTIQTTDGMQQTEQRGSSGTAQPQTDDTFQLYAGAEQEARPLFQDVKAMPVKVGETYVVDTQAPAMDTKLAGQLETALEAGAQRVELRLTPENLGTVVVEMTRTQDGALHVVFHTSTEKAASLLSQHSAALGELLQSNHSQNTVQVTVQHPEENQQFQQNQSQHHGQNAPQQEHRRQRSEDFLQQLRLGLIPMDAVAV